MLIIRNHVYPPYGKPLDQYFYIPPLSPAEEVIRADACAVPYLWSRGKIIYISEGQYATLTTTPEFGTPDAVGAICIKGHMPKVVLVLGKRRFVFDGFPAGNMEAAIAVEKYLRKKLVEYVEFPERDVVIDLSQTLFDPDYLVTLCTPSEADEILAIVH